MMAIARRELRSYFCSPVGYVVLGVLFFLYAYYYYQVMRYIGASFYISNVYSTMFLWSMMVLPILTMRCLSEEQKNRTDQALLTAPVSVTGIVLGKYLAALAVYGVVILGSLLPAVAIGFFSAPNWAMIFGNALGSFLYGVGMIAIGVFLSSLTQSQVVAAISTFGAAVLLLVIDQLAGVVNSEAVAKVLGWISFQTRYQPFTTGTLNLASVVFFLSVAAVFLFFTARRLESRRWA